MEPEDDRSAEEDPPPIRSRPDAGGPWSAVGALLALGLIGLMIVQSCMPSVPSPAAPAASKPAAH